MSLVHKKRIFYIMLALTAALGVLIIRLGYLQITANGHHWTRGGHSLNEMAVRQRRKGIELDPGRGQFTDNQGRMLTGSVIWTPILFPVSLMPGKGAMSELAAILQTTPDKLASEWADIKQPTPWQDSESDGPIHLSSSAVQRLSRLKVQGIEALPIVRRYTSGVTGSQWLGYVSEQPDTLKGLHAGRGLLRPLPLSLKVGGAGLERTFDYFLRGGEATEAYVTVDGYKRPMKQVGVRITGPDSPYYPLQIRTTINREIQKEIEKLTEQKKLAEGAVVVLDVNNGDIVAMVSRPFYDPNHIDLKGEQWSNRAVKASVPGSIFKTVIAAAALEAHAADPQEQFLCKGEYGKYHLSCWKPEGHGPITLEQGYINSCNTVFAALGERLSASQIEETAHRLGIGRSIGWQEKHFLGAQDIKQIDQEEAGLIFDPKGTLPDSGVRAQTAIGQRDVLMTPLQAANLVVTLLHDGTVLAPRLVSEIRYADGSLLAALPPHTAASQSGRISSRTARTLLGWMRGVVTDGTGRMLRNHVWELAGKSGTAQVIRNGQKLNDQWFMGYGPAGKPRYAAAVLVQSKKPGAKHQATELFYELMDIIAKKLA
ncbi:penicillin-binding transpeptidase domain-containing protein [Paenibacillus sp. YPG26]|uniref:peptidoglycan D,D-transpeptidase FtsI family protein n=1 Tax=Paenibacillus sp. YPG26 TaxID=2878915 RepID=UPI00203AD53F|nr:penicillin-binding transpeptidase domain-containing protein [Paenibacillus sp. YPG26]USB34320.1 peptidoglycan glycosyltransferase [Paenibacillus sp. YPG26]